MKVSKRKKTKACRKIHSKSLTTSPQVAWKNSGHVKKKKSTRGRENSWRTPLQESFTPSIYLSICRDPPPESYQVPRKKTSACMRGLDLSVPTFLSSSLSSYPIDEHRSIEEFRVHGVTGLKPTEEKKRGRGLPSTKQATLRRSRRAVVCVQTDQ